MDRAGLDTLTPPGSWSILDRDTKEVSVGLYDEVVCEYPLPEWPAGEEPLFQTKDLDCLMERYRISADGRLLTTRYRRGDDDPGPRETDTEYHGYLVFYTSVGGAGEREWFEYRAKFTDGRLVEVDRIDVRSAA